MAFEVTEAERLLSRRRMGRSERAALVLGAIAVALGAAAWIAEPGQAIPFAAAALSSSQDAARDTASAKDSARDQASFRERFLGVSSRVAEADQAARQPLDRSALNMIEGKLWDAKALLARQLMYGNWRAAAVDDIRPSVDEPRQPATTNGIPLPRPRPAIASQEQLGAAPVVAQAEPAPRADNRTLMQKISDFTGRVMLASLTPEPGLLSRQGPDLAALGYDNQTAVYDLTARALYLPNGMVLEAHSGMGSLRDDPDHVDRRMVGATPPAIYDLKPREKLFHGVAALRMNPAEGNTVFGRAGLLVHPYMLGPLGDSNGCVSVRNYDRFLKAYNDGEVSRLVVIRSLSGTPTATQRSTSQQS
jgi:hypothetical protein